MAKPAIFAIDDDPEVLQAIEHDLRRYYGKHYRVLRAHSGDVALETLKQLKLRNEAVALFVVDQRMPHMSGTDFLIEAMKLFPEAPRVLLTAYADTEAAIKAINTVKIDYYMVKPWSPPEQIFIPCWMISSMNGNPPIIRPSRVFVSLDIAGHLYLTRSKIFWHAT